MAKEEENSKRILTLLGQTATSSTVREQDPKYTKNYPKNQGDQEEKRDPLKLAGRRLGF